MPAGCEVKQTVSKGYGLFATAAHELGSQAFSDEPLFALQHTGNRRVVCACASCCGFVGSISAQLETMFGEARFAPLLSSSAASVAAWEAELLRGQGAVPGAPVVVRCTQGCGEVYCSERCRDAHFRNCHNLLCTGPIQTEDHPLLKFKYHAIEHADTFLLAGQVFAFLINRAMGAGGGVDVMRNLMSDLLGFCHAPFRDACRAPPGRGKDAEFIHHTDQLIAKAAMLLHAALEPHAPVEVAALFEGGAFFFSEVLGLFEYNNIDVEVPSPLGALFVARGQFLVTAAHAGDARAAAELEVFAQLLREKEWVMQCVVPEETTGIYGDDGEAAGGQAADAAMDEATPMEAGIDEAADLQVATAAMAEARRRVDTMSFAELLEAPWPSLHGTALFATVARVNHSCAPNLRIDFPMNCARLTATALAPIAEGEELCISYIRQEPDVQTRRRRLLEYGFVCSCPRCLQEDSGTTRRAQRRLK